jgi:hypothetical protein
LCYSKKIHKLPKSEVAESRSEAVFLTMVKGTKLNDDEDLDVLTDPWTGDVMVVSRHDATVTVIVVPEDCHVVSRLPMMIGKSGRAF